MLRQGIEKAGQPTQFPDAVLVHWRTHQVASGLQMAIEYLGPAYQPVVDIYSVDGKSHFGWWRLPTGKAEALRSYRTRFDLVTQQAYLAQRSGDTKLLGWQGERADGDYKGYFFLWQDKDAVESVPLFDFTLRDGRVAELGEETGQLFIG